MLFTPSFSSSSSSNHLQIGLYGESNPWQLRGTIILFWGQWNVFLYHGIDDKEETSPTIKLNCMYDFLFQLHSDCSQFQVIRQLNRVSDNKSSTANCRWWSFHCGAKTICFHIHSMVAIFATQIITLNYIQSIYDEENNKKNHNTAQENWSDDLDRN